MRIDYFSPLPKGKYPIGSYIALLGGTFPATPETISPPPLAKQLGISPVAQAPVAQALPTSKARRVATRRYRLIFTSPLGMAGEATTIRKSLLGE